MIYLSKIYTKAGDGGDTGLGDGSRVRKNSHRVSAYGEVDELNAVLGIIHAQFPEMPDSDVIRRVQNDLFDVGADLCVPAHQGDQCLRVQPQQCEYLEQAIDRLNENLQPLTSFILPGGEPAAAWLHLARTVCRRAERAVVSLMEHEQINEQVLIYLNRLSDYFFVLSRAVNTNGDVLWVPGKNR